MAVNRPETEGVVPFEPMDAQEYLRPIWSRKWLILLVVAIATTLTYVYYSHKPKVYTASTRIFVKASAVDQVAFGSIQVVDEQRNTIDQAHLLKSRAVAEAVAKQLRYEGDPAGLLGSVTAVPDSESDFVTITTRAPDPKEAADLANAFAEQFIQIRSSAVRDRTLQAISVAQNQLKQLGTRPQTQAARSTLNSRIHQLQAVAQLPASSAQVIDHALPPGAPIAPKPRRNAVFALFISLLFGILGAFGLERFDRRIKRLDDIEHLYGHPLLTIVPHKIGSLAPVRDGHPVFDDRLKEPFRTLRTSVQLASLDRPVRTILVTSAIPAEGKSTVVRNLALAFWEAGKRVSVIESDLRRPSLASMFGARPLPGLTTVLAGSASLEEALQPIGGPLGPNPRAADAAHSENGHHDGEIFLSSAGELRVLTAGVKPSNPPVVLGSKRVKELLAEVASDSDVMIIDSPPLLAVSDTVPLLSQVDSVILVSRMDLTTRDVVKRLRQLLRRVPSVEVLGVVANDVSEAGLATGYGYAYYGYEGKPGRRSRSRKTKAPASAPAPRG